jgi:hypothetical protein
MIQAFKKLSKGLSSLADSAAEFESNMIGGLLRSAPDLAKYIEHVESMFQRPEKGATLTFVVNDLKVGTNPLSTQMRTNFCQLRGKMRNTMR